MGSSLVQVAACWPSIHYLSQYWTRTTGMPVFWDTHHHHIFTHTSDSHQIPSQNKTKSKLQILKIVKNSIFEILQETLHATHLLTLLNKMYKYEMDPTRTVGATEQTRDVGRTDRRTDRWMDGWMEWNQYTPQQLCCVEGIIISNWTLINKC